MDIQCFIKKEVKVTKKLRNSFVIKFPLLDSLINIIHVDTFDDIYTSFI